MGLFRRKEPPAVAPRPKPFRIELGWRGLFGLVVVCFCLFVWMFLFGLWAGQTIVLPPRPVQTPQETDVSKALPSGAGGEDTVPKRQQRTPVP